MRQTDFSLEELEGYFSGTKLITGYPRCLLVNEVGDIARYDEVHSAEAQRILVALLKSDKESDRWIAIRHLADLQQVGVAKSETELAIADFASQPENLGTLPKPKEVRQPARVN